MALGFAPLSFVCRLEAASPDAKVGDYSDFCAFEFPACSGCPKAFHTTTSVGVTEDPLKSKAWGGILLPAACRLFLRAERLEHLRKRSKSDADPENLCTHFHRDMDVTLGFLERLTGRKPDYRFKLPEMGIEVCGLADFCVVAGSDEKLYPLRALQGPLIVDDLAATEKFLVEAGAVITKPNLPTVTGRNLFARHPDGSMLEYVEWKPELRLRILG